MPPKLYCSTIYFFIIEYKKIKGAVKFEIEYQSNNLNIRKEKYWIVETKNKNKNINILLDMHI